MISFKLITKMYTNKYIKHKITNIEAAEIIGVSGGTFLD